MEEKITLKEALLGRKSTRSYLSDEFSDELLNEIKSLANNITPLIEGSPVRAEIITKDEVKAIMPWRAPYYIAIYSADSNEGRLNAGYVFEQVVLRLTQAGIATCWATSVSAKEKHCEEGESQVAVIAFGYPKDGSYLRNDSPKRDDLKEISDFEGDEYEAARIAPSAMNNQPWKFVNEDGNVVLFCKKQGFIKKFLVEQNRIDLGIALGNMAVVKPFSFKKLDEIEKNGYIRIGKLIF